MADNKTLPPTGTGTADIIVATDEIAGVDYQKIKLVNGTADSTQVAIVDATGSLQTINAGTQVLGTDVYTEATSKGVTVGAVRRDADTTLVGTDNEFGPLQMDQFGRLKVEVFNSSSLVVIGLTAADQPLPSAPVTIGGRASAAAPADVSADGDVQNAWLLRNGARVSAITGGAGLLVAAATSADNIALGIGLNVNAVNLGYDGTNTDLLRTIPALDAAPNVDTGILAVGVGPGWDRKTNPASIAATSTANAVTVVVDGADAISFHVTALGATPGSMIFEQTGDDSNWATAGAVLKLGALDTWVEGAFVPALNDVYMVRTNGARQIRYRVNAVYASGSMAVEVTSVNGTPIIKSVEMPGAPHKIGYPLVGVSAQYTTTQTSTTLGPTVASTQRLVVTSIQIQAGGTTAGELQVYFGTGAFSRGTSKPIFDGEFAPSATLKPGFAQSPSVPWMGAADEELKVTDSAAINKLTVTIWYYLVTA